MVTRYVCIDVSTAPLAGCERWLEPVSAPSHYKDPAKIAAFVAEKNAARLDGAALDLDLAWVTGVALYSGEHPPIVLMAHGEAEEAGLLTTVSEWITGVELVGYNIKGFDGPMLMRRSKYLGIPFPSISTDRYRSSTVDLLQVLSDNDPSRRRSLRFYCRRHGWTDCEKPLSGAEEAMVPQTGAWAALEASLRGDVMATYRLACWLGVIEPVKALEPEPII